MRPRSIVFGLVLAGGAAAPTDAWHSPHMNAISTVAPPTVVLHSTPCPQTSAPVLTPSTFLVVNNTNVPQKCRLRHPLVGGWTDFVTIAPGKRLLDGTYDVDQMIVHCARPMRQSQVRVFARERYSMLQQSGATEARIIRVVAQ